ncbi:DUF87 domain-containing protein [Luteococcus sp. H138]|uniref:VirB4-like conjugal transfer ATPase, CD1110 family n=1 Tax=unclassified Luteococcus TaxID=2639923 RepID=UPI00313C411B
MTTPTDLMDQPEAEQTAPDAKTPADLPSGVEAEQKNARRGKRARLFPKSILPGRRSSSDSDAADPEKNKPGEFKGRKHIGTDDARPAKRAPRKTSDVLGYRAMLPSGVAWLGADEWSATLRISDINYLAAEQDTQEAVVDRWARFLNSFGAGMRVEVTVLNRVLDDEAVASLVAKELHGDEIDQWREDFNKMVRGRLASVAGNTITQKFLTVTVQESDREKAEANLIRTAHEAAAQLAAMDGCRAELLNRAERLQVFSHILRPYETFAFDEDSFDPNHRVATADFVAPWAIERTTSDGPLIFRNPSGDTYHQTLWIRDYPAWLSDRLISELADIKCTLSVSLHLEPYDQVDGMTMVQRQIAELEMQTIAEQKKAAKAGYDQEFIPHKLQEANREARELRTELEQSNQKMFSTVIVIGLSGPSREILDQNVKRALRVIRKLSCQAEVTSYMQHDALTTELPIGVRRIPMRRTLTTASAAIIVPFTTQELHVKGGSWYGLNAQSGNAIVADRTKTVNGNGFILGTTGSGKSQAAKAEITNVFLDRPDDDIIIIDPEREYEPLMQAFRGSIVRIDAGSRDHLNAMDIELGVELGEDDPIKTKADFVLSMLGSLIGSRDGLTPTQRSLIDRCAVALYRQYSAEQDEREMPTLGDLREALAATQNPEAIELADALEIYTVGSLNAFAQQTNVDVQNRLISYDISRLGTEMRTFGMMVILDQVWNRVARNRAEGRRTWLYIDEFHLLFSNPYSAEYFRAMYKRARKWGLIPTGITQNIEELLSNEDARLMLANSNFLQLLAQTATDADSLCHLLHLSEEQRRAFTNVPPGCGLLRSGNALVPFDNRMPTSSKLYRLFSTKFGEE